jgi:hypothetical protein
VLTKTPRSGDAHHKDEDGRRVRERFTLTRAHLGQLVDELSEALED